MSERIKKIAKLSATIGLSGVLAACGGTPIAASPTSEPLDQNKTATHLPTESPTATTRPANTPAVTPETSPPQLTATQELIPTATLESTPTAVSVSEGKFILFSRNVNGKYDLFRLSLTTKAEEDLTNTDDADEMNAQVSPDGTWAVFYGDSVSEKNPGGKNILWKIDFKNKNKVTALTSGMDAQGNVIDQHWYDPTISPDGKTIACKLDKGEENEHGKIYLMDSDGTNIRELVIKDKDGNRIHGQMWKPEFNVDGTKLYITVGEDDDAELYLVNIDGTNTIRLTHDNDSDWFAAQNPTDPNEIAYTSNQSGHDEIYTRNIVTGKTKRITYESINDDGTEVADPSWSQDGNQITAVENDGEQYDVVIMDSDGKNLRHLTNTPGKGNDELSPVFVQ